MIILRTEEEIISKWKGDLNNPVVSIGCITYNHEKYIRDALEGFLIQETNFPFQICILDDASTDDNVKIIKEYADKYPRLFKCFFLDENTWGKPYRQERIKPYLEVRNKGKYIALCEGDDYWIDPLKLQKQVDILENNKKYSLCFHNVLVKYKSVFKKQHKFRTYKNNVYDIKDVILIPWFIPTCSILFRKAFLDIIPEWSKYIYNGDYMIQLLLADKGEFYCINEIMGVYRRHETSLSSLNDRVFVISKIIQLLLYYNQYTLFKYNNIIQERITSIFNTIEKSIIYNRPLIRKIFSYKYYYYKFMTAINKT